MPPKAKITKEMIINAAFDIARTEGAEQINARTVSQKLGCSTQPVMYNFQKSIHKAGNIRKSRFVSYGIFNEC